MKSESLLEYVRLLVEKQIRQVNLSGNRTSDWGSDDHISDLETRLIDAVYWRDKHPKGSEKRSLYRNICNSLKRELQSAKKKKQKLQEGGLVKHLMHLSDNRELTFGEIKNILENAASGKLEKVSEKMDGMNLVFTYDVSNDRVLAARNSGDIKGGGVDAGQIAAKFAGRGSVEEAFNAAFRVLRGAIGALSSKVQSNIFGPSADRWYSIEIIYTKNPNVINYDSDNIVFHGWPIFKRDSTGSVSQIDDEVGGIETLTRYVDKMQKAVTSTGWKIKGPSIVTMKRLSDGTVLQNALQAIDSATRTAGVNDSDTIESYLYNLMQDAVKDLGLNPEVSKMVVTRCLKLEGAPTLTDIKKKVDKTRVELVSLFVKNSPALLKQFVKPIELAINEFAVELLKGLNSTLIDDSEKEVIRLRNEVQKAISAIETSGDETAMSILSQQMEKLKSVENITSPVEGVVFIWKGNAYKFTGSFAAAGQILGLFRYGRGGTKLQMPLGD